MTVWQRERSLKNSVTSLSFRDRMHATREWSMNWNFLSANWFQLQSTGWKGKTVKWRQRKSFWIIPMILQRWNFRPQLIGNQGTVISTEVHPITTPVQYNSSCWVILFLLLSDILPFLGPMSPPQQWLDHLRRWKQTVNIIAHTHTQWWRRTSFNLFSFILVFMSKWWILKVVCPVVFTCKNMQSILSCAVDVSGINKNVVIAIKRQQVALLLFFFPFLPPQTPHKKQCRRNKAALYHRCVQQWCTFWTAWCSASEFLSCRRRYTRSDRAAHSG